MAATPAEPESAPIDATENVSISPAAVDETQKEDLPVVPADMNEGGPSADAIDSLQVDPPEEDMGGEYNGLKVLFLSSDTGGGHRASAESLAKQFELLFPGSTYDLLDLATEAYLPPYNSIVSYYKHLSNNPSHWKLLYGVTNSRFMERAVHTNIKVMTVVCERNIRERIKSYHPDVVVSVHPLQTSVPILSCAKISHETGQHLPMFTVVTDLGSAHSTWFANGVEKMFVGSKQIRDLAKLRGKVPDEKLVLLGLPIRHDFAIQSEQLGSRLSKEGIAYQQQVRKKLGLPAVDRQTLLVMGGGEGVGSLANIVDALYVELSKQGLDAVIMVVCGRNETLKESLEKRDWAEVFIKRTIQQKKQKRGRRRFPFPPMFGDTLSACGAGAVVPGGCIEAPSVSKSLRRILSSGTLMNVQTPAFLNSKKQIEGEKKDEESEPSEPAGEDATVDAELESQADASTPEPSESSPETIESSPEPSAAPPDGSLGMKSHSMTSLDIQEHLRGKNVRFNSEELEQLAATRQDSNASVQPPDDRDLVNVDFTTHGKVDVVGLGFVTNMAEYMVAADILVSKAGPGTISEAAALSLPVMLTSFLPGQEEGNVDYVIDGKFGAYCHDSDPDAVAEELARWLQDSVKLQEMSEAAKEKGAPFAAKDIVQQIGDSTMKWRELNVAQAEINAAKAAYEAKLLSTPDVSPSSTE